jgi:hypothetical protein
VQGAGGTGADLGGQAFQGIRRFPGIRRLPRRPPSRKKGGGRIAGKGRGIPGFSVAVPEEIFGGIEEQGKAGFFFNGHSFIEP